MDTESAQVLEIPETFKTVLNDFSKDLSLTFPEYDSVLSIWASEDISEENLHVVYSYCLQIYPERFFDILYQNEDIFENENETNTAFLPGIDFKFLFNTTDVSETTKQTMWKYLQLVLITIMSSVKDKSSFGETMNLFDGIDESELHTKLSETISNLNGFFKNMNIDPDQEEIPSQEQQQKFSFEGMEGIPDPASIHEHLKGLFDGKIGKLAKELAEELSGDLMNLFDEDDMEKLKHLSGENAENGNTTNGKKKPNMNSTQDIFKKLMKNPKKIMELLKTVGTKLEEKMKQGDISKEDIMKEAGELMGKMKGMGNGKEFQNMMKNLTKNMGGLGGLGAGLGKDTKFDFGGIQRELKKNAQTEKMREKLEKKRASANASVQEIGEKHYVYKAGSETQEKSMMRIPVPVPAPSGVSTATISAAPINDDWLDDEPVVTTGKSSGKKKKKGKK